DTTEYPNRVTAHWASDSRWMTYTKQVDTNGKENMYLYNLESKQATRISQGFYDDANPVFDSEGKYIYFLSNRFFYPISSNFDHRFTSHSPTGTFALTHKASEPAPFGPQVDEEKEPEAKKADAAKKDDSKPAEAKPDEAKPADQKPVKPVEI